MTDNYKQNYRLTEIGKTVWRAGKPALLQCYCTSWKNAFISRVRSLSLWYTICRQICRSKSLTGMGVRIPCAIWFCTVNWGTKDKNSFFNRSWMMKSVLLDSTRGWISWPYAACRNRWKPYSGLWGGEGNDVLEWDKDIQDSLTFYLQGCCINR